MSRSLKGCFALILILCCLWAEIGLAVSPSDYYPTTPEKLSADHLYGRYCIVLNANTGDVLFEKDADSRAYPASTTKIMTCILGIERAERNDMLDKEITIPNNIGGSSDSSKLGITSGDRMRFEDLLYGMMLASGNDAALAVAQLVAGSPQGFVNLMNDKAEELGLSSRNTNFVNPHGLHEVNHYTTARDLAKIMAYAVHNETFRSIIGATEYTVVSDFWPDGKAFATKYDLLLKTSSLYYAPCIGGKTGYTKAAGRSFVAAAEQSGTTLVSVCLNPKKIDESDKSWIEAYTDTIRMFKYGFTQYEFKSFKDMCQLCDSSLMSLQVVKAAKDDANGGWLALSITDIPANYAEGYLKSDLNSSLRLDEITKDFSSRIRIELINNESPKAPITTGQVLGTAFFTGTDGAVYTGSVVASRDVEEEPATMDELMDDWLNTNAPWLKFFSPRHNRAAWLIYIVLLGLVIFLIVHAGRKRRALNRARKANFERRRREYLQRMKREDFLARHPEKRGKVSGTGKKPAKKR